jgi:3-methyl-2-oxobutanoate hydroxymethyltransferase
VNHKPSLLGEGFFYFLKSVCSILLKGVTEYGCFKFYRGGFGMGRLSTHQLREMKVKHQPIVMITAYDYPSAKLAEKAGVEMILVGDSLGMVVLGYDSTLPVTLDDMVHHAKAVTRGATETFVVADMPFLTYHGSIDKTLEAAGRLMQEGLVQGVKMEGGREILPQVEACVNAGIPVVGHLGLTPQSVYQLGGYRVQGKSLEAARRLMDDARALEEAGAFAIVLECVPRALSRHITEAVSVPTIGIGAGEGCDGQVLVFHDILQYGLHRLPKFAKPYANIGETIIDAVKGYADDVRNSRFPDASHGFEMNEEVISQLYGGKENLVYERD